MVRVEGTSVTPPINWDGDNQSQNDNFVAPQDISFNGTKTTLAASKKEWDKIDLQQLASRRNAANALIGALSVGFGYNELGPAGDDSVGDDSVGDDSVGDDSVGDDSVGDDSVGDEPNVDDGVGSGPTSVQWTATNKQITITWNKPLNGVLDSKASPFPNLAPNDYNVFRVQLTKQGAPDLATMVFIAGTDEPIRQVTDSNLSPSVTYVYLVNAVVRDPKSPSGGLVGQQNNITTSYSPSKPASLKK